MFLPQTSLDTDPNMAYVPKLWLTNPSASVEFALKLCCALASSNSDETSSKASFRSLRNMRVENFGAFWDKIWLWRKRPKKPQIFIRDLTALFSPGHFAKGACLGKVRQQCRHNLIGQGGIHVFAEIRNLGQGFLPCSFLFLPVRKLANPLNPVLNPCCVPRSNSAETVRI